MPAGLQLDRPRNPFGARRYVARLHNERAAKCLAAKGANFQDGDACQNDFRIDVSGAMDHAAWSFLKRDGVSNYAT